MRAPGPGSHRWRAGVLTALLLMTALALQVTAPAGPREAVAATGDPVVIDIESLQPGVPTSGVTLRVRGTVTNNGKQGLRNVEVRLRLSSTRLGSRAELHAVTQGRTTSRDGEVVVANTLPDLAVGQSEPFELSRPVEELAALTGFGVYVLGVEVLASRSSGFGRVAILRAPLPWVPSDQDLVPTGFSWLWPLVARPTRLANGTFIDDSLASGLADEGRLTRLVEAGARLAPVTALTWVVDPELVAAAADMADGYRVRAPNGDVVAGAGGPLAIRWLEQLRVATGGEPVLALPYADVDVTAVERGGMGRDVTRALTLGRMSLADSMPAADVLADTAWPVDGYANRSALALLRRSDVRSVVLDGRAVPPELDLSYTPTGRAHVATRSGRLAGLLADPGLADLLREGSRSPLLDAQRLVAETAMIASELPSGPERSVLVMPPRRWSPDQAYLDRLVELVTDAAWVAPVTLRELAMTPPPEIDRSPLAYPKGRRAAELPKRYLSGVSSMRASVAVFAAILTDPTAYLPGLDRSTLLLESTWWRGREERANRLARERGYLADRRGEVRVQPGNFTFSSRRGTIALTVANGLPQAVQVNVRLEPQTTRLRLQPIESTVIGPRSKQQIEVQATAVAPGPVTIDATLRTLGGAVYGQPVQLRITITEYGTVALYITLAAAGVLFIAAGVRVLRRLANARRGAT